MNAVLARYGPTLGLLYGATFWGVVWYPTRILEDAGMHGAWLTLVGYGSAALLFAAFARIDWRVARGQSGDVLWLMLGAGWTNLAFVLAVLEGEVVRVVLLFYLSPIWTVLLGRWLLAEHLTGLTWLMLSLGIGGALVMLWDPAVGQVPLNRADLLAASAGLAFAVNNVMTRRLAGLGVRAKTQLAWVGVVVVSLGYIWLQSPVLPAVSASAWWGSAALGIGGFLLSTLLVVYGVSSMPVQRSAVIMLFELVVSAASSWWLAGETMVLAEWLGGGLILSAALIAIRQEDPST